MHRTLLRLTIACVLVVVGWGSSASAWDTTAGNDTNYGSITFGGTNHDGSYEVAVDGAGNVYTTGYFRNTVDFGAGNVTAVGSSDAFVTKLNSAGAHQWTTTFGGTGDDVGFGVAVDGSGNVHLTGRFAGTVDFGAGNVTAAHTQDAFVTKLNSAGAHQWTTTFSGVDSTAVGFEVAVDGSGNVHIGGYFTGTVNFGAGNVTAVGSSDAFVTKLNSAGAHQWTTTFGSTDGDYIERGEGVAVDGSGNVHVAGEFLGTVDFGAG
ncbi:MAG: SBBP repeat-containing protein, partial [Actinomycetota bacterium]|nr:SBBP repeat-containing protein [Actinomycetota bacterium]